MGTITSPSADDIYKRAREKGVGPQHFVDSATGEVMATDADVIDFITNDILPNIKSYVEDAADSASRSQDFPFSDVILKEAYPWRSDSQITESIANQQAPFYKAIEYLCLSELFDRVASTNPFFVANAERYRQWGMDQLERGLAWIKETISLTPEGQQAGLSGFGVVEIDTTPTPMVDEFGRILFPGIG